MNCDLMIIFDISAECNLQCVYCYNYKVVCKKKKMSYQTILDILNWIKKLEYKNIVFILHGGEPLTNFNVIEYLFDKVKVLLPEKNIIYSLQTNGLLLNEKMIEVLNKNNCGISISYDGTSASRVDYLGNNVANLIENKIINLVERGIKVSTISVINKLNKNKMIEILDFISNCGINYFSINLFMLVGNGEKNENNIGINEIEAFEATKDIIDYIISYNQKHVINIYETNISLMVRNIIYRNKKQKLSGCYRKPCNAGKYVISFDVEGNIYPCQFFHGLEESQKYILENIKNVKNKKIKEIVNNSIVHEIQEYKLENYDKCRKCAVNKVCGGVCTAIKQENEEFGYLCKFYKLIYEYLIKIIAKNPKYIFLLCDGLK